MEHLIKPYQNSSVKIDVTTESAGWHYLSFKVVALKEGESHLEETDGNEVALVPLSGQFRVDVAKQRFEVSRDTVFTEMPHVLYVPPRKILSITALVDCEFAIGGAPAEGKYPVRMFKPAEMKQEVRGGGPSTRQVNHILQHPLPAERLILFEVYVPGGMWSGYPPHSHDGHTGSPYLEEIYYYRISPEAGFALHRNYQPETDFDEVFTVKSGDLVLVTQGFHPVAAPPGSNVYFLNFLAGELLDEGRAAQLHEDPDWSWIKDDWSGQAMSLPVVKG
jgi:5-deoxy-glucuronate isomerase